ncbi:MAG: phenylacetate--CoA ligase family protein [Lachnospiraceae bacterium]|nr:phenylacetate--CoA ligase family protein [Lachnospiraceae bacterium]
MKKIGMIQAMRSSIKYKKMNMSDREKLQNERMKEMVQYARKHSSYYAKCYENLPEDCSFTELPPVNKKELMEHWEEWVTDPEVKLADVNRFMENMDNVGRKFHGKYMVFTTSGSTGNPLVALCDNTVNNVMAAINTLRAYARKEDLKSFMKKGGKTIGVFATGGFYLSNSSVRSRLLSMPWKKKQMAVTSALLPIEEIVKQLNEFQPNMLGGYPSNLELLIDEARSGRLHISPVIIMTGGEYLSDSLRNRLAETFHCYVQTSYSCTEGGSVACECCEKHFHINDDWIIVEPVDKNNNPVPDGVLSDKVLLTNLYNFTQPYIRYEVSDRIIMHHEQCACGNLSPWIELEGRTDDVTSFVQNGKEIKVAPLAIYAVLKEVHQLRRFQLVVTLGNVVEMRLEPVEGVTREEAFEAAKNAFCEFMSIQGITELNINLSETIPQQHPKSGKFKHIINECGK